MMTMQLGERANLHMTSDYGYGAGGFPAWVRCTHSNLLHIPERTRRTRTRCLHTATRQLGKCSHCLAVLTVTSFCFLACVCFRVFLQMLLSCLTWKLLLSSKENKCMLAQQMHDALLLPVILVGAIQCCFLLRGCHPFSPKPLQSQTSHKQTEPQGSTSHQITSSFSVMATTQPTEIVHSGSW